MLDYDDMSKAMKGNKDSNMNVKFTIEAYYTIQQSIHTFKSQNQPSPSNGMKPVPQPTPQNSKPIVIIARTKHNTPINTIKIQALILRHSHDG